jgi:hypothetical protein
MSSIVNGSAARAACGAAMAAASVTTQATTGRNELGAW